RGHAGRALRRAQPVLRRRAGGSAPGVLLHGCRGPAARRGGGERLTSAWAVAALAVAVTLGGCGGVRAADLFIVSRTGSSPQARLTLLVNEEGGVHCNGGRTLKLSDPEIVRARGS